MAIRISVSKCFTVFYTKFSTHLIQKSFSSSDRKCYDIIISGGGLIGQTVASTLSKISFLKAYSILLIESNIKKTFITSKNYSNRVLTIIPATKNLFDDVGIWNNINRFQTVTDMKIWSYLPNHFVNFIQECPTYVIENNDIINAALCENEKAQNVEILFDAKVNKIILSNDEKKKHIITLNDGRSFETGFLIGCDGADSLIRKTMDTQYLSWEYEQWGIAGTLHLSDSRSENTTIWQRYIPGEIISLLPLAPGISSLGWCINKKMAEYLLALPNEQFVDALNQSIQSEGSKNKIVNNINACATNVINSISSNRNVEKFDPPYIQAIVDGSRALFPLGFGYSAEYVRQGVALVGDSVHKVHPMAGQGVNIGFRDIRTLENKLVEGILNGRTLGNIIDLENYQTKCQMTNIPIMTSIELLYRLYTSKFGLVQILGNYGMNFLNSVEPLKAQLVRAAGF